MKTRFFSTAVCFAVILFVLACRKYDDNGRATVLELSEYQGELSTARLGRVLFYDKSLSANNGISCGSCHIQAMAFSDGKQFSLGFDGRQTKRNTPGFKNLGTTNTSPIRLLFWDGRESFLGNMVLRPMLNHVEMGMSDFDAIVKRVKQQPYYSELFRKAFNSEDITIERIAIALSDFVSNIHSFFSRFESVQMGHPLNMMEVAGMELFNNKYNCASCHNIFSDDGYQHTGDPATSDPRVNIGLDMVYQDSGLASLTKRPEDVGKFKVPSLHNVALTAPYMHDGRFKTLEEVLDHYSHGVANHPNLDPRLTVDGKGGQARRFTITPEEKTLIIAFLKSMTDTYVISDPRFSNPFKTHTK